MSDQEQIQKIIQAVKDAYVIFSSHNKEHSKINEKCPCRLCKWIRNHGTVLEQINHE